ncbi:hypothetical protein LLE72_004795 [Xanthomonas campestris pv. papavericola]|uniref:Uncharacterized protein n=1 Tax=Xanthomonas campestris pv. papavericola TaxID=487881 RepID=A0AAJ2X1I7_XANCA|nr:hypothetical protein [Xanthomonas campestris]MEC3887093.1 hypothetical protein [Xanthomonas campestris pv. papavericola]
MSKQVLTFQDLRSLCAPNGPLPRLATVERWAQAQGIRYKYDGHGGIWTNIDALNAALGLRAVQEDDQYLIDLI